MARAIHATGPLPDDATAALDDYLREIADRLNDTTYMSVLIALLDRVARDQAFADLYRDVFDLSRSRAATIVRHGIEQGVLRRDVDVDKAVIALLAPFTYIRLVRHELIPGEEIARLKSEFLGRFGARSAETNAA
jgi:hypothetical protein